MLDWLFGRKKEQPKQAPKKEKKPKTQAQQQSQDKWQYEFLLQFLNSPLWRVSILDFVDQNCIVFDSEEENKFQYTKIHNQFKKLVAQLFDGMMKEIGLDDQKLAQLLQKGFESKQKKLFNQLLLCDDFLKFKELMVKRNKQLQKQALNDMQGAGQQRRASRIDHQRNLIHESMKLQEQRKKKLQQEQQQVLRKVLQLSLKEQQERKQMQQMEIRASQLQFQKISAKQKQTKQKQAQHQKQQAARIQQQKNRELQQIKRRNEQKKNELKQKMNKKKNLEPIQAHSNSNLSNLPPVKAPTKKQPQFESPIKKQQQSKPVQISKPEPPKIQPISTVPQHKQQDKGQSAQQRKKRLLEQREKIRKKKQQQRRKMLQEQQQSSRKVQNIVLQQSGIHDSTHGHQQEQSDQKISKTQIERRKQIMKKIKNRIVDDF